MHLSFRTWTAHRAFISPVVIMEPKGLMRPITARVGFCRCAGKMYLYSDAWPSSTFTIVSWRKGKAKVYPVAKTMISMGSSFGVLLNTTEFSFTSFTLGLMSTFPVMIWPGSSLLSTGSLSCVLDINTDGEETCQGPVSQPSLLLPSSHSGTLPSIRQEVPVLGEVTSVGSWMTKKDDGICLPFTRV